MYQLIPGLIGGTAKLLGGAALGTGLINKGITSIDPLSELLGQTEAQQALEGSFDRTADPGQRLKRDGLQKFLDWTGGRDLQEMEETRLKADTKRINTALTNEGYDLDRITQELETLNLDPRLLPKLDDKQSGPSFRREVDRAISAINTAREMQLNHPEVDITGMNVSEMNLAKGSAIKEEKDKLKDEVDQRRIEAETKDERRYRDRLLQLQEQNNFNRLQMQNNNAYRMQQLMQQNNRLDREDARRARESQQAFVAMLLQGLNNLSV